MNRIAFTIAASLAALSFAACSSTSGPSDDEEAASESAALANTGGTVGSRCNSTTCPGCRLVYIGKTDTGCRQYQCQCDTEEGAKCVTGTKVQAGSVGAVISVSPGMATRSVSTSPGAPQP